MAKRSKSKVTETPATQWLRRQKIEFSEHVYDYVDHGGAQESARQLDVSAHEVVKTLIMQDEKAQPMIVLMHGDQAVSTKNLARQIGCKSVTSCDPTVAQRHSGYQIGGTSPFATRKKMPIYMQSTVFDLDAIYVNGGRRGYLIGLNAQCLADALNVVKVECAIDL